MDPVTSAQFRTMKDSFARQGVEIEAALYAGRRHRLHLRSRPLARSGPR